jgi:hypothetical protein
MHYNSITVDQKAIRLQFRSLVGSSMDLSIFFSNFVNFQSFLTEESQKKQKKSIAFECIY